MEKIAIQGTPERGKDVIKTLESLGGINIKDYNGKSIMYYYVNDKNHIDGDTIANLPQEYKKYTLKEYEQTLLNNIETKRNIQIDLTTAKEWYKQGGDLRKIALQAFSEQELQSLPKSWEEYCKINPYLEYNKEVFLHAIGTITPVLSSNSMREHFPGVIPTQKRAKQFVTLNKLLQIRDYYNQGWIPNWTDRTAKYTIWAFENKLNTNTTSHTNEIFTFKSKELRDIFFENFKEDLEFIKEFL